MKFLIFLALPFMINAQVQINTVKKTSFDVGTVKKIGVFATLSGTVYDNSKDTIYALCLQDQRYTRITSIECVSFNATLTDIENIYKSFKSCFEKQNKTNKDYQINMTLGEKSIRIFPIPESVFGGIYLYIGSAYTSMSEKHVDILFGKR